MRPDWGTLLAKILPPDQVKTALIDRVAAASDAGFYHLLPEAVVLPKNEQEIASLFQFSQDNQIPLVFRAAGTSLSGQSITDGILVDISKHWREATVLDRGDLVTVEPGIIGATVNQKLAPYGRKIGPDPASIAAAMMGGILSNNASGMCCGVANNCYHTLHTMRFMLPDGSVFDTSSEQDYARFEVEQPTLAALLLELKHDLLENSALCDRIRRKYRMKNTVGYGLNAFLDYNHPLDILAHLMIGAEGTLGFISKATLQTLPDLPAKSAAMLYFPGIAEACKAIPALRESGAEALELMDRSALRSVEELPGLPSFFTQLPKDAVALLCEYQATDQEALALKLKLAEPIISGLPLMHAAQFTTTEKERGFYWKIRKGMFPSVGAVRKRGTTVILEDVTFPIENLAAALPDLQQAFDQFGYDNAIIFGHAKDGNIHFVITQHLDTQEEIDRYDRFMRYVADLVLQRYDGALKGEHGTGRNMAPFVEAEWGGDAYRIMQTLKQAIDPHNLLNPGVIINSNPQAHITHLKDLPEVEHEVDKCIECGFCEHHCPSRDVTLTPRQRIQVRRHLKRQLQTDDKEGYALLQQEYQYAGLDTCAADGLCQTDCPVHINTGDLVKRLRAENHSPTANANALRVSKHFKKAEQAVRLALQSGHLMNRLMGKKTMPRITSGLRKIVGDMPSWWPELHAPPPLINRHPTKPDVVYFSACLNRMMGRHTDEKPGLQQVVLDLCERAGLQAFLPKDLPGHCCGQAFGSKGFNEAAAYAEEKTIDALLRWSNDGALPIVCDFTSCSYQFTTIRSKLSPEYQAKFDKLRIVDILPFLQSHIIPTLPVTRPKEHVVLHPVCAATKLGIVHNMQTVAQACARQVTIPAQAGCCGMAGDRGFLFPELTESATQPERDEVKDLIADGYYSSGRTCEMALTHFGGKPYEHIAYLLWEASTPAV